MRSQTIERSNTINMTSAVNNNNYDLILSIIVLCPPLMTMTSITIRHAGGSNAITAYCHARRIRSVQ
jgi:hypothetical protein